MAARVKVLIIDDDQDFRDSVKSLLESHGYDVVEADSGKQGLRRIVECRPDIILLDVMMESSVEGYGITYTLKYQDGFEDFRNTPVFMVSSIEESPDERFPYSSEAEMIRPDRYLAKPLDVTSFLELMRKASPAVAAAAI